MSLRSLALRLVAGVDGVLRPQAVRLAPRLAIRLYSKGRGPFLRSLVKAVPRPRVPPAYHSQELWGLTFRSPLGNAAGMFKNGEGYGLCAAQGAGFYLAGSSTALPRPGNREHGVTQPFAPYPRSGAASNFLGLPNDGDRLVARRLHGVERTSGCPVGASVSAPPELEGEERLKALVEGLKAYEEAGVDFLEVNESCPNVGPATGGGLARRLEVLRREFLEPRSRSLPVLVKFSCDTRPEQVPELVALLLDQGFDGVDFGNTSKDYGRWRPALDPRERCLYDDFSKRFGGGVSGRPLKEVSLQLAGAAAEEAARRGGREFHVMRTGGVETAADVAASRDAGIALNGWYTGYFEAFARHGHGLYEHLYESL